VHLSNEGGNLPSVWGVATESCSVFQLDEVASHTEPDVGPGRDEAAQWEYLCRKFGEIASLLAWAEMVVSPGDASAVELPNEQANAIPFCVRRARRTVPY